MSFPTLVSRARCEIHVIQYQKLNSAIDFYIFDVSLKNATGLIIDSVNHAISPVQISGLDINKFVITASNQNNDAIEFSFAKFNFASDSLNCQFEAFDSGSRQRDCGFEC